MSLSYDDEHYVSIPRGGPIYVPDAVGPLTRVPDFETLVFQELQVHFLKVKFHYYGHLKCVYMQ